PALGLAKSVGSDLSALAVQADTRPLPGGECAHRERHRLACRRGFPWTTNPLLHWSPLRCRIVLRVFFGSNPVTADRSGARYSNADARLRNGGAAPATGINNPVRFADHGSS